MRFNEECSGRPWCVVRYVYAFKQFLVPSVHAAEPINAEVDAATTEINTEAVEPSSTSQSFSTMVKSALEVVSTRFVPEQNFYNVPTEETGFDRIKKIFQNDEFDQHSVELEWSLNALTAGFSTGFILGTFFEFRRAGERFTKRHELTRFESKFEAHKRLQDNLTFNVMRKGWSSGWRVGVFTGLFVLTSSMCSVYRNKSSVTDFIFGGMFTGALYKTNFGLRGMFAGGLVGATFGLVGGSLIYSMLWMSGTRFEELKFWQRKVLMQQHAEFLESRKKRDETKNQLLETMKKPFSAADPNRSAESDK